MRKRNPAEATLRDATLRSATLWEAQACGRPVLRSIPCGGNPAGG
jgi:hypothetical protein